MPLNYMHHLHGVLVGNVSFPPLNRENTMTVKEYFYFHVIILSNEYELKNIYYYNTFYNFQIF